MIQRCLILTVISPPDEVVVSSTLNLDQASKECNVCKHSLEQKAIDYKFFRESAISLHIKVQW